MESIEFLRTRCMNGEDWGLGRERLPEKLVTRASWDLVEGR